MKPPDKAALREARLAARLKANLARRKDQARSREAPENGGAGRPSTAPLRGSAQQDEAKEKS